MKILIQKFYKYFDKVLYNMLGKVVREAYEAITDEQLDKLDFVLAKTWPKKVFRSLFLTTQAPYKMQWICDIKKLKGPPSGPEHDAPLPQQPTPLHSPSPHPAFYFATHKPALQTWAAVQHEVPSILTQAVVPVSGQAFGSGVLFTHWSSPHVWSAPQHKTPVEAWQTMDADAPAGALQKLFATQIPLLHFSSAVQQSAPSMLLQSVVPNSQVFVGSGTLSTHWLEPQVWSLEQQRRPSLVRQTVAPGVRHGLFLGGGFLGKHFPAKQRSLDVQQSLRWRFWQRCSLRSQAIERKMVSVEVGVHING